MSKSNGSGNGAGRTTAEAFELKVGLAEMLKNGVIMDVTTAEEAKVAEDAGACAVMALERVPADIRRDGGVARMSAVEMIEAIHQHSDAQVVLDVTQALGRIPLDLTQVDLVISSTHKWILSSHGGGLVGIPSRSADRWNVQAGGWFNLQDAFGSERFEQVVVKPGAAGFTVGMPNFPAVYAIRAGLAYINDTGVEAIDAAARPQMEACLEGLAGLPVELISPRDPSRLAGILAFRHPDADAGTPAGSARGGCLALYPRQGLGRGLG